MERPANSFVCTGDCANRNTAKGEMLKFGGGTKEKLCRLHCCFGFFSALAP